MKTNSFIFSEYRHKFIVANTVKNKLNNNDYLALSQLGLPKRLLSNTFVYRESMIEENNKILILGYNTHVPEWLLKINLDDNSIFCSGKGKLTEEIYFFYNSSVSQLLLSIFTYDFFIRKLILAESLGEYHINHEKYANLLFELIRDIDLKASQEGVWYTLIEEMKLGVI